MDSPPPYADYAGSGSGNDGAGRGLGDDYDLEIRGARRAAPGGAALPRSAPAPSPASAAAGAAAARASSRSPPSPALSRDMHQPYSASAAPGGRRRALSNAADFGSQWVPDEAAERCPRCGRDFTAFARRRHHCRSCGGLLCDDCSPHRWETRCLPPEYNRSHSHGLRVCRDCNSSCMALQAAVRSGDTGAVARLVAGDAAAAALLARDLPLPLEAGRTVAHLCASSGSLDMMKYLRREHSVDLTRRDDTGATPFAAAASALALPVMRWLAVCVGSRAAEVHNVSVLRRAFDVGILGYPPMGFTPVRRDKLGDPVVPLHLSGHLSGGSSLGPSSSSSGGVDVKASAGGFAALASPERQKQHALASGSATATASAAASAAIPIPRSPARTDGAAVSAVDEWTIAGRGMCLVCWERPSVVCMVPCGHVVACLECEAQLESNECPYCRGTVAQRIQTYCPSV